MKKLLLFSMMFLMALTMQAQNSSGEYVDLGLPSGTLWKSANEKGGFVTWEEAMQRYGDKLPSLEQWEELKGMCKWTWTGKGYKVTGDNGNSIVLPASGCRYCDGSVGHVGLFGFYWSSTRSSVPKDSDGVLRLYFNSERVSTGGSDNRCSGFSVRLVQDE